MFIIITTVSQCFAHRHSFHLLARISFVGCMSPKAALVLALGCLLCHLGSSPSEATGTGDMAFLSEDNNDLAVKVEHSDLGQAAIAGIVIACVLVSCPCLYLLVAGCAYLFGFTVYGMPAAGDQRAPLEPGVGEVNPSSQPGVSTLA